MAEVARTIRLTVAYDGTAFHGWQTQPALRTVQGVLEQALEDMVGESIRVVGAGRTDAGCHARGQVVSFATRSPLPQSAWAPLLERRLPADLRVREAREAPGGFDARRSALARRYAYRLLDREDLLLERIAWQPRLRLDGDALERAVRPLVGERDCSSLRSQGGGPSQPLCRVSRVSWRRWEGGLMMDVVADHFLYRMVRNIVGTALQAMRSSDPAAAFRAVLEARDRGRAGPTAPPQGLCLEEVFYPAAAW